MPTIRKPPTINESPITARNHMVLEVYTSLHIRGVKFDLDAHLNLGGRAYLECSLYRANHFGFTASNHSTRNDVPRTFFASRVHLGWNPLSYLGVQFRSNVLDVDRVELIYNVI